MRILLLNQYYVPDVAPTGRYLHDIARELVRRGHSVTVWCSRRSYNGGEVTYKREEVIDGVYVQRLRALGYGRRSILSRLGDYATFYGLLARRCMLAGRRNQSQFDAVVSLTTPPYIGILGNLIARRCNAVSIQWVMDVYPDVMVAHGMAAQSSLKYRMLQSLTRWQLQRSHQVWALGDCQRDRLKSYIDGTPATATPRLLSVPLWRQEEDANTATHEACDHLAQAVAERRTQLGWQPGEFGLMYSGNMGLGHRFQEIIEAMTRFAKHSQDPAHPRIRLAFVGGGKRFPEVQKQVQERGIEAVTMHGYVPQKDLVANLRAADLHLVTLDPAWKGLIVPSKLMNVLAAGKPVLYIGHPESEIAKWVREGECGWCVAPDDVDGLMAVLREASSNPDEVCRRGAAARLYAERRFSMALNAGLLANELLSMIAQRAQGSQTTLSEIANRVGQPASLRLGRR